MTMKKIISIMTVFVLAITLLSVIPSQAAQKKNRNKVRVYVSENGAEDGKLANQEKPTTNPEQPTTNPEKPTTSPEQPTTSPEKPTTSPEKPTNPEEPKETIFIAAGHQQKGISSLEYMAPGSKQKKAKLTSGTTGVATKIPEYKTNLAIAKATKTALENAGYKVVMLRTTNDCPLSNQERTKKANASGASLHICIHCNGSSSSKTIGPRFVCQKLLVM